MKKLIILSCLTSFSILSKAQIPNSGFENWTHKSTYDVPDQWGTMNNTTPKDSAHTVEMGSPGSPGAHYIRMISKKIGKTVINGMAVSGILDTINMQPKSGFAYSGRPKSFTGKWQYMWMNASPGAVSATLTKWNSSSKKREVVGTAAETLNGMKMQWATFSIDFSYLNGDVPDSCIIFMQASGSDPGDADYLFVDGLGFNGSSGIIENTNTISIFKIYPNPATHIFNIEFSMVNAERIRIQMTDISGKIVKEMENDCTQGTNTYMWNTDGMKRGTYLIYLISSKGIQNRKIVLE